MGMQITDVRVRRIEKEGKMKAIVSITLDNEFVVHDIKVIEGEKGLFIAMPSRKAADGEYRDIAHPINSETRDMIQNVILAKYEATALELAELEKTEEQAGKESKKRENMKKCPRTLDKVPGDIYYVGIVCSKTGRFARMCTDNP